MKRLSQYFFRGLIAFLPVALTVYVLILFVTWAERSAMALLRPVTGDFYLPGLGIALGALLILGLGVLISLPSAPRLLSWVELPFTNLPVVKNRIRTMSLSAADSLARSVMEQTDSGRIGQLLDEFNGKS